MRLSEAWGCGRSQSVDTMNTGGWRLFGCTLFTATFSDIFIFGLSVRTCDRLNSRHSSRSIIVLSYSDWFRASKESVGAVAIPLMPQERITYGCSVVACTILTMSVGIMEKACATEIGIHLVVAISEGL